MDRNFLQYLKNSTYNIFPKKYCRFHNFLYEKQLKWVDEWLDSFLSEFGGSLSTFFSALVGDVCDCRFNG